LVTAIAAVPRNSGAIMSTTTQIEWTDATWNPVTGCSKITRLIVDKFARLETTPAEIERFVVRHTPFRETHYKKSFKRWSKPTKLCPSTLH
jgi:protein gp37